MTTGFVCHCAHFLWFHNWSYITIFSYVMIFMSEKFDYYLNLKSLPLTAILRMTSVDGSLPITSPSHNTPPASVGPESNSEVDVSRSVSNFQWTVCVYRLNGLVWNWVNECIFLFPGVMPKHLWPVLYVNSKYSGNWVSGHLNMVATSTLRSV